MIKKLTQLFSRLALLATLTFTLSVGLNLIATTPAFASPIDTFEFRDETMRIRFNALSKELRCPKCQNQNLADSNSPIAKDLRVEIYEMLNQGKSDQEIVDFMVYRYGEFVLYRPKVSPLTYVLWFAPVALILIGIIVVLVLVRKKPKVAQAKLTEEQQAELDSILKK